MNPTDDQAPLILNGIEGANPLGFLAALGSAIVAYRSYPGVRLAWTLECGAWRPALWGCGTEEAQFVARLHDVLCAASMQPFEIDNKLPFANKLFEASLRKAQLGASPKDRRAADLLAAFGSEVHPEKGVFRTSLFRMVRSGDSAGNGLPAYARAIRSATDRNALERTLFAPWDYQDAGFSLRWDPLEDQRYALRWRDPSKSSLKDGPGTMLGANSLALEALQWYPTMPQAGPLATTGFHRESRRQTWFTWPIWEGAISLDAVRSLLTLPELHDSELPRQRLAKRGIVEAYRSQRIAQNQYYSNFAPSRPA